MELVILVDIQNAYASGWVRVSNTSGLADIHIGDRFREQGFGAGAEELEVAGVDISPVGGFSRLFFNRGANATAPEVHRLGTVFIQVGIKALLVDPAYQPLRETIHGTTAVVVTAEPELVAAGDVPLKRGRGRPPGAKNKPKETLDFPPGF